MQIIFFFEQRTQETTHAAWDSTDMIQTGKSSGTE